MGKKKVGWIIVLGIILVAIIFVFTFFLSVRNEFTKYLDTKYPQLSFKVGFAKTSLLYNYYYADVICLNDDTHFVISKNTNTKNISQQYIQNKSQTQYNTKLKNAFNGSAVQKSIRSVTGGGEVPFKDNSPYKQINIYLINNTNQIADAKEIMRILKTKVVFAGEFVSFTYEKDKNLYELWLSLGDSNLTEKEIGAKAKRMNN